MSSWLARLTVALCALGIRLPPLLAEESAPKDKNRDEVVKLARLIDRHINAGLKDRGIPAAPIASDAEFCRRIYLDLAGRIPKVSEVRAFLEDKRADKRMLLVEKLLKSNTYINHFTNTWRFQLMGGTTNQQAQFLAPQLEQWSRKHIKDNTPYDVVVRELLTVPVANARGMGFDPNRGNVRAFYQVNENKPDMIAASTSKLFLGVKIECAQCHDHPFAKWTRKQFWEYTAFFGGIKPQNRDQGIFSPVTEEPRVREIKIGDSEKKAQAKFLDGTEPKWGDKSTRQTLADWVTSPDNPYFARAVSNRMWEHFFGIGLVDPVDDFREENPASHPALVDDLAKAFAASKFDLQFMIRAITASEAYQRTSEQTHPQQDDMRAFSRMPLKGLAPEQVFDSLATAVGYRGDTSDLSRQFGVNSTRSDIQTRFTNPVDRRTEFQTSILQALSLMNGKFVADATSLDKSETLLAVIDSPFMNTRQKLDTLYMAALSRPMRDKEASRLVPYVEAGGPSRDAKKALADVFWVLLNSSEFILNH
jgi:hypothetical protein